MDQSRRTYIRWEDDGTTGYIHRAWGGEEIGVMYQDWNGAWIIEWHDRKRKK